MPAYVIADIQIENPEVYEEYRRVVPPTIKAYGGRFVVRGGQAEALEGEWKPNRIVVLEFDSVERAKAWWNSDEYNGPRALRWSASSGSLIVVDGV